MSEEITSEKPQVSPTELVVRDDGQFSVLMDTAKFNQAWRIATAFSKSNLVPKNFQGDIPSVFIVLQMALRLEVDPFMMLQNTYTVHGRPGMEAKLQIALANQRGPFKGPIQWDIKRDAAGKIQSAQAYATHKVTNEECRGPVIDWELVKKEKWDAKDGSKWLTMPEMMFRYRSASWFIKLFCPETVMGIPAADELEDSVIDLEPQAPGGFAPTYVLPDKPETVKAEPVPPVTNAFDDLVAENNLDPVAVDAYIEAIRGPKLADVIKGMAVNNWAAFLEAFKKHNKPKRGRLPGVRIGSKPPDGPQEAPTADTPTQGPTDNDGQSVSLCDSFLSRLRHCSGDELTFIIEEADVARTSGNITVGEMSMINSAIGAAEERLGM